MDIKTLAKREGDKAKRIYYGRDGECMQETQNKENYIKDIICRGEFHGEYDIVWFVVVENGKETSRHNAKFIETIEWI